MRFLFFILSFLLHSYSRKLILINLILNSRLTFYLVHFKFQNLNFFGLGIQPPLTTNSKQLLTRKALGLTVNFYFQISQL